MIAGQQFAAGPGLATVLPDFDFETYSEAGLVWNHALQRWDPLPGLRPDKKGLKGTGVVPYVKHPSFEVLMLAYDLKDGRGPRQWFPGQPPPQDLFDHIRNGGLLEAHNVFFEWTVWELYCVPVLGWPSLIPDNLRCSAAKSAAHALPRRLANVGAVLQIENQKMEDGARMIAKWTMPRKPTKKNPRTRLLPGDDPADWLKFCQYNARDIVAESEVSVRVPDLTPFELDVWRTDQRINWRGMAVDMEGVDACISIVQQAFAKYNAELRELTNGAVPEASKLEQLKAWAGTQGVHMTSATEEAITELLTKPLPKNVARALRIRQLVGSASVKKLFSIRAGASATQRLHDLYIYYSSHTGRWAGQGPQPQNLYKGTFKDIAEIERALAIIRVGCLELVEYHYGDALECVNNVLRSLIVAAPGHDLVCSDYTGIENVVAAGLAGEEWVLDVYRTTGLIYEATASVITGIPLQEFIDHKKNTGKHHPMRNKMGKFGALGSQFGGWIGAWKGFGADEFLSDDEIKTAILKWRDGSPFIVEAWGGQTRGGFGRGVPREELFGLEGAAIAAVKYPGQSFPFRQIAFQMHGDCLYMRLPSGRFMAYHEPRLMPSTREWAKPWELELSYMGWNSNPEKGPTGWLRMKLYGGLIFENATQAAARDIQAGALVRLERAGYNPVLHTHDEIAGEIPKGWGSIEEFEGYMVPPANDEWAWCRGWPIKAAGGWRGPRYGKFD